MINEVIPVCNMNVVSLFILFLKAKILIVGYNFETQFQSISLLNDSLFEGLAVEIFVNNRAQTRKDHHSLTFCGTRGDCIKTQITNLSLDGSRETNLTN